MAVNRIGSDSAEETPQYPQQHASTATSAKSSVTRKPSGSEEQLPNSSENNSDGGEDEEDRIRNIGDVWEAIRLTWQKQKSHLFTSWVHVPLGVMFLLTVVWAFRLAIDQAPFRFPAPVIAMILFFAVLLSLDWLSLRFPGRSNIIDVEKEAVPAQKQQHAKRRFVDPIMALLAPPCEFCLRNMSVMFTPSFILIPAREVIPGPEIGLIAAWFTISQVLAFVFPVVFIWGLDWVTNVAKKATKKFKRKNSMTPSQYDASRRGSTATISGVDWEKGRSFAGGYKLGVVATGLSGLTANVIAPISHLPMDIDADAWRQIESTALEQARQQGDPAVTGSTDDKYHHLVYRDYSPKSDVSNFQHHHHHRPGMVGRSSSRRSARSRSRSPGAGSRPTKKRSDSTPSPAVNYSFPFTGDAKLTVPPPTFQEDIFAKVEMSHDSLSRGRRERLQHPIDVIEEDNEDVTATRRNSAIQFDIETRRTPRISFDVMAKEGASPSSRRPSQIEIKLQEDEPKEDSKAAVEGTPSTDKPASCQSKDCDDDAIERLSGWIGDLITPTIYLIIFIVGIPLFFLVDIALPLFLGINILTFIAAITIVPPKIRRYLHPILSCSISTVLIIWAFAAMKGIGLKDCLNQFYSIDIKYLQLWAPAGYEGRIPGAGDVLFSTLDAGIVALAVPMYRYRKELKENFAKMTMVLVPCASLSLFFWNSIAALMGMDQIRSLAFTARFMSTPLAIELANNIGADESITVILVVITGIVAAVLKDQFFRLMRVDREDFIIIGITMGSTAGAIGASSLISTPRVMAVASLSFVIFGSILLIATAIPPIVDIVRMLA